MKLHLDGVSFRSLADQFDISVGSAFNYVRKELEALPHCADITRKYCQKFSGILLVDGKYIKVKRYDRKIPVLYGIDYITHDIPSFILSRSENYQTCAKYFNSLKLFNYQCQALVCDDNRNIYEAFSKYYPMATVQLCLTHFKENIRRNLQSRKTPEFQPFVRDIETLFSQKRSLDDFDRRARKIVIKYQDKKECMNIMFDIERRKAVLLGYLKHRNTPTTTNLIESFNSHLESRVRSIKGFESFSHAKLWLNAYFIRRRTKKFTDCRGKFRHLNGKTSLSQTKNPNIDIPTFF